MITWQDDEPLEGEPDIAARQVADLEWAENVAAWEREERDRVEAHE